uniref:Nucleoprotein n=1 Tax=Gonipterus platensis bunyan-like virus TaxID=2849065 RepID=A0A8F3BZA1_9VIRU|nr:putative nucleocapsid protein [Gonipterus platensis bunyan-like virus]
MATSYWDDIVTYLKSDDAVKVWLESDEEAKDLEAVTREDIADWTELFTYKGFNVLRILRLIKSHHDAYMADSQNALTDYKYKIIVKGVEVERIYTNKEKLHKDIQFLITLFVVRGNNTKRVLEKANPDLSAIIEMLKEKLHLDVDSHQANAALDDKTITIPRICACFPTITCNLYNSGVGKYLLTLQQMGLDNTVSKAVLTPFFTSCIPHKFINKVDNENLLFFISHIIVDDVIHKKDKSFTDLTVMLAYYKAAYGSPGTPQTSREKFMKVLNLADQTGATFNQKVRTAAVTAEVKIRQLRPDDPNLDTVISELKTL